MKFGRDNESVPVKTNRSPREIITSELDRDEDLIWVDRPESLISHAKAAIPKMLFGIPFFAFSLFWIYQAFDMTSGSGAGFGIFEYAFPLFGVPFVLVGLSMLLSPLWKMFKARYMIYAMTDKRLIIREGMPTASIKSWPLANVSNLSRYGTADGPGDLFFSEEVERNSNGNSSVTNIGFIGVSEPRRLEEEIRSRINRD